MQYLRLSSSITDLPGIGPAKANLFKKLQITHIRDILFHFPRKYEDFSKVTSIKNLKIGETVAVRGKVSEVKSNWGFQGKRRLLRIHVDIKDDTGTLHVTWFNLRFLEKQLQIGTELFVAGTVEASKVKKGGKIELAMRSPAMEFINRSQEQTHTASITPVYSETHGISSRFIRYTVKKLLPLVDSIPEYIPADIIKRRKLIGIHQALKQIHFPENKELLELAQKRLRFDELFFLQLAGEVRRRQLKKADAHPVTISKKEITGIVKDMPFPLTGAQKKAVQEILKDMAKPHPMNRLLQGDVGSGKSAVATLAVQATLHAGFKAVYLAPTEILARQQAQSFSAHLGASKVSLLVGALTAKEKKAIKEKLKQKTPHVIIGTHALLQTDVTGQNVALAIIDEQHRFGVSQRKALKIIEHGMAPHLLSMTATPIPRTLNLTVYGDLDTSVLDELPPGRQPISTKVVPTSKQHEAVIHLLSEVHTGRQGYVIAPLVEQSEKMEVKSAKKAYEEIKELLPGVAVGLLHGQMTSEEKEQQMRLFASGAIQVLVATAVVEVGVNVPNATVMIIEGAERFGLSQLHQFRGRIGRGEHKSFCYLFPSASTTGVSERLRVMEKTQDGFVIAEEDLQLRGPGEVYGVTQSGFSDLKVASLLDYPTIAMAKEEAKKIIEEDYHLDKYPILQKKVEQKNLQTHFE